MEINVTEAILVAKGHGLIDVKIPSQKAVNITNINLPLFAYFKLSFIEFLT